MRRAPPFPISCTKAVLCAILSAKGGRHHAQTNLFSRAGLCSLAAGRLWRKAADHTGLCADLCRQPARRVPHHTGRTVFCRPCAAADQGQGGHSGQSERRVRLRAAGVGAACHWRRRFARVSLSVATDDLPRSTYCCCRISTGMPTICGVCWMAASEQSFCRTLPRMGGWA